MNQKSPRITYEAVAQTATELEADGQRPTVRAVLAVLGGSPNAVLPHLQAWKAARPIAQAEAVAVDPRIGRLIADQIAEAVTDATRSMAQRMADLEADSQAVAEAATRFESESALLAERLAATESDNAQLVGQVDALTRELEQLRREHADALVLAKSEARELVITAKSEAAQAVAAAQEMARREREVAEAARQDLARAELRLEALPELKAEIHACREAAETSGDALALERQKTVQFAAELAAERRALQKAEAQLEKLAAKLDSGDAERRTLAEQIAALQVQIAKTEKERAVK